MKKIGIVLSHLLISSVTPCSCSMQLFLKGIRRIVGQSSALRRLICWPILNFPQRSVIKGFSCYYIEARGDAFWLVVHIWEPACRKQGSQTSLKKRCLLLRSLIAARQEESQKVGIMYKKDCNFKDARLTSLIQSLIYLCGFTSLLMP